MSTPSSTFKDIRNGLLIGAAALAVVIPVTQYAQRSPSSEPAAAVRNVEASVAF